MADFGSFVGLDNHLKRRENEHEHDENSVCYISNDAVLKEKEYIDIDEYLFRTGGCGPYQKCIVLQMMIIALPLVFPPLLFYFIGHDPDWISRKSVTMSDTGRKVTWKLHGNEDTSRCDMDRNDWTYYYKKTTLTTEFDLVCDKAWLLALSGSSVFIGWGVGSIIMGYFSDKFGRKAVLIPTMFIDLLCILLHAFIESIYLLILVRFIMGVFHAGPAINNFILVVELVGPNYRVLAANCNNLTWIIGSAIMTIKAYFINDWRLLCIALSAPYFVCIIIALSFPESVRWLNLNKKTEQAESILRHASVINQKTLCNVSLKQRSLEESNSCYSYVDLIKNCKFFKIVLIQGYIWLNSGMVYYTFSWVFADIGGNMYVNFFLSAIVEAPMHLIAIIAMQKWGRKSTTYLSFLLVLVASVLVGVLEFFPNMEGFHFFCTFFVTCIIEFISLLQRGFFVFQLGVALVGKCAIALGFLCIYMWSSEIYPTVVRSQGMGFNIITSRTGAALSPFIKILDQIHPCVPFFIMAVTSFVAFLLCFLLPETLGKPTRETFEDLDQD